MPRYYYNADRTRILRESDTGLEEFFLEQTEPSAGVFLYDEPKKPKEKKAPKKKASAPAQRASRPGAQKLDDDARKEIVQKLRAGGSATELGKEYGVTGVTIGKIAKDNGYGLRGGFHKLDGSEEAAAPKPTTTSTGRVLPPGVRQFRCTQGHTINSSRQEEEIMCPVPHCGSTAYRTDGLGNDDDE